ncbi:hypothetical protein K493DRAFT_407471 [Basidiobolus meristosporus CBS 931.73]|uniref:Uncharacterized protein n=1 Tax=Basidiobolus meristosporus CBS 931.73 TaxID=1314790 RepID=A0A1Y1YCM2_9FUNG|nr:hypothetical protein K493DRAFT_407471 [Basidiobolus meristosporus CBS 931.73]|eukprot:ORX95737.1 hypothetical protein K493DRAFT_407471 [Basidiobolus meristosporus CBS 931.73]
MSQKLSKKALDGLLRDLNGNPARKEVKKVKKSNKLPDTKKGLRKFKLAQLLQSKKKVTKSLANPLDELRSEKKLQEEIYKKNLEYFTSTARTSSSEKELKRQVLERMRASELPKETQKQIDSDDDDLYE